MIKYMYTPKRFVASLIPTATNETNLGQNETSGMEEERRGN